MPTVPINPSRPPPRLHFTLYSRSYCHLCDDMLQALRSVDIGGGFTIDVVDIDTDAPQELLARYDELVPVLLGSRNGESNVQICHYFLDFDALNAFLGDPKPTALMPEGE